jgi:hypothetical protein
VIFALSNQKGKTMDDMKMLPGEFADLRAQAALIGQTDVQLGRLLDTLILHLGHAHGLDIAAEDARLAADARVASRAEEDAQVKANADALVNARALEDAQTLTPAQVTARDIARGVEDKRIQTKDDDRVRARAEEDALTKEEAPVADATPVASPAKGKSAKASDTGLTPDKGVTHGN